MIYACIEVETGKVKFGFARTNPFSRASAIQIGNPREVRLVAVTPGTRDDEQELHDSLADWRLKGEWFRPSEDVRNWIIYMQFCMNIGKQVKDWDGYEYYDFVMGDHELDTTPLTRKRFRQMGRLLGELAPIGAP